MSRLKGAAILIGLMIVGFTLLSGLPASGGFPVLTSDVARRLAITCPRGEERPLCRFVASIIQFLDADQADFLRKSLVRFRPAVRLAPGERNCDGCVQATSDVEAFLATNGTALGIQTVIFDGCDRFRTPAKQQECQALVSLVPHAIDRFLAEVPPFSACSSGDRRPFNHCQAP
jgi:hypothetical protein